MAIKGTQIALLAQKYTYAASERFFAVKKIDTQASLPNVNILDPTSSRRAPASPTVRYAPIAPGISAGYPHTVRLLRPRKQLPPPTSYCADERASASHLGRKRVAAPLRRLVVSQDAARMKKTQFYSFLPFRGGKKVKPIYNSIMYRVFE